MFNFWEIRGILSYFSLKTCRFQIIVELFCHILHRKYRNLRINRILTFYFFTWNLVNIATYIHIISWKLVKFGEFHHFSYVWKAKYRGLRFKFYFLPGTFSVPGTKLLKAQDDRGKCKVRFHLLELWKSLMENTIILKTLILSFTVFVLPTPPFFNKMADMQIS